MTTREQLTESAEQQFRRFGSGRTTISCAVVRSELDASADLPLDAALGALNDIVGLDLIARQPLALS